jgi:hypothetical protein
LTPFFVPSRAAGAAAERGGGNARQPGQRIAEAAAEPLRNGQRIERYGVIDHRLARARRADAGDDHHIRRGRRACGPPGAATRAKAGDDGATSAKRLTAIVVCWVRPVAFPDPAPGPLLAI